jgi:hypothetical protein
MSILAADSILPATAIVVAIIAGAFSFLGLVLSKEQKISELREAWIDGLRADYCQPGLQNECPVRVLSFIDIDIARIDQY